jgi:hypothetical protein
MIYPQTPSKVVVKAKGKVAKGPKKVEVENAVTAARPHGIEWHYIAPGTPTQNPFVQWKAKRRMPQ